MPKVKKASLIAIGVGQGDAFFLEKGGRTVLVDGGRSRSGFPAKFQMVTDRDRVDIIVCTHNDADHALGVLGFLESGLTCNEVWLPGSWTDRLEDMLLKPDEFAETLLKDIERMRDSRQAALSLQVLGDQTAEKIVPAKAEENDAAPIDCLYEAFDKAVAKEVYWDLFSSHPFLVWGQFLRFYNKVWHLHRNEFSLFLEALSAAERIRAISLEAYHRGASIRWFEYDSASNSGGKSDFLVPLNARETAQVRRGRWTALEYLALTTSNKQSLVFLSPQNDKGPAVLFAADSDLSFPQSISWTNGMAITAPHHGSEDNAYAYKRFDKTAANGLDALWVRSDGNSKKRPGCSYLKPLRTRFCTICRGSQRAKQDVRLTVRSGKWKPLSSKTKTCCCV
jgi:hypothetical protein